MRGGGARAGDILGVRRVFLAGISVFTLASLLGGLAEISAWLLTARAVQGAAAAAAAPSILSVLLASFAEGPPRTRAVAIYSAVSGGGASAGLVLGGVLTDALAWRWGLFVNVPVGVALVLLASRSLPDTQPRPGRFDVIGGITSTLGMTSLVYGFARAASGSVADPATILALVLGIALLTALVVNERRAAQPIYAAAAVRTPFLPGPGWPGADLVWPGPPRAGGGTGLVPLTPRRGGYVRS